MRYVILGLNKTNIKEVIERKKYIEHIFRIYTIPYFKKGFVEFHSIPANTIDLLMIVGHNDSVYNYLNENKIKESNIALITCFTGIIKKLELPGKNIYISKNRNGYTEMYDGAEWNINFQISDSELTLYNTKDKELNVRLEKCFERIDLCEKKCFERIDLNGKDNRKDK